MRRSGMRSWCGFTRRIRDNGSFHKFKQSVIGAFHSFVISETPENFPRLRFGFVEVSSDWVPYVVRELTKRFEWKGSGPARPHPARQAHVCRLPAE